MFEEIEKYFSKSHSQMAYNNGHQQILFRYLFILMKKIIVTALLLCISFSARTFKKILVSDPDALCLDGSKPAYYLSEGDPTKFILSFEGGGWCGTSAGLSQTVESCYQRSKTALGSSTSYADTMTQYEGILSDSIQSSFRSYTIAHLKYCDGTGHQGYRKQPISYKDTQLYFRGHNATTAQLNSIDKMMNLFNGAKEIIVTGQSAGGLATFLWSNYIADRTNKNAKVWSLPDSGIFLDSANFNSQKHTYLGGFEAFMMLSNEEVDPPTAECVAAYPTEKWKCLFAEYLHPFIKIPLFPIQSLYDSWSLANILGISCGAAASLAKCTEAQMNYINQYRLNTSAVLKQIGKNPKNGGWGIACSQHVYSAGSSFYSPNFRVPANTEFNINYSIVRWMAGTTNPLLVDTVAWPNNAPCSGLTQLSQEEE